MADDIPDFDSMSPEEMLEWMKSLAAKKMAEADEKKSKPTTLDNVDDDVEFDRDIDVD